ncbi:hypothetical protein BJM06_a00194 (plasmid) [Enterobacter cloacae]|nr:hypothetical protein BJM06_a00194 [Enterobacter cloacae]
MLFLNKIILFLLNYDKTLYHFKYPFDNVAKPIMRPGFLSFYPFYRGADYPFQPAVTTLNDIIQITLSAGIQHQVYISLTVL